MGVQMQGKLQKNVDKGNVKYVRREISALDKANDRKTKERDAKADKDAKHKKTVTSAKRAAQQISSARELTTQVTKLKESFRAKEKGNKVQHAKQAKANIVLNTTGITGADRKGKTFATKEAGLKHAEQLSDEAARKHTSKAAQSVAKMKHHTVLEKKAKHSKQVAANAAAKSKTNLRSLKKMVKVVESGEAKAKSKMKEIAYSRVEAEKKRAESKADRYEAKGKAAAI